MSENIREHKKLRELQQDLKTISRIDDRLPKNIVPDGIYGSMTRAALIIFQQSCGLAVTGLPDTETEKAAARICKRAEELLGGAEKPDIFNGDMKLGSNGTDVRFLQVMLDDLSERFDNIYPTESNGIYGRKTAAAVKALQTACGLSPTGITDLRSWNRITQLWNILAMSE